MKTVIKTEIKEFVFNENEVTDSCHASTVLPFDNGNTVAAWFGGTSEGNDDVKIWVSVRDSGGWGKPYSVSVDGEELPHWNPALFLRENGEIILYFKYGKPISEWVTYYAISRDGGRSFTKPQILVEGDTSGGRGPVKNKPIRLFDKTVVAPASKETKVLWRCFADISRDDGLTFERSKFVPKPLEVKMIQPTLWEDSDGLHMLTRTSVGEIYRSDSLDGGFTWKRAYPTGLPNPNSGIDLTTLCDGSLVLIMNPVKENWGDRAPLVLMRSFDGGKTFEEFYKCEATTGDHEFSYPAIVAVGKTLYMTYTYERKKIAFIKLEIE